MFTIDDDRYAVAEKWYEYRTPSGRWSKVRHEYTAEVVTRAWYECYITPHGGDRVSRMYTREGYIPYRISNTCPSGERHAVAEFTFLFFPDDVERARAKFPDLFPPTFYDLIVGHEFMLDCVGEFDRIEDREDYAVINETAGQFGDWVAGTLARYDADNDRYVFDYVTANFEGRIGSVTRIEGDRELFDPNVEDVVYPMPGWDD